MCSQDDVADAAHLRQRELHTALCVAESRASGFSDLGHLDV